MPEVDSESARLTQERAAGDSTIGAEGVRVVHDDGARSVAERADLRRASMILERLPSVTESYKRPRDAAHQAPDVPPSEGSTMKRLQFLALLTAAAGLVVLVAPRSQHNPEGERGSLRFLDALEVLGASSDEPIVVLVALDGRARRTDVAEAQRHLALLEATRSSAHADAPWRVTVPRVEASALYASLRALPAVRYVEPEMEFALVELRHTGGEDAAEGPETWDQPDDPLYPFQWNFQQIGVERAWQRARGAGAVVAVIDTGVAYQDDESRGWQAVRDLGDTSFVQGFDFVDRQPIALDHHGHGTHVAGTIAQSTNNGYGVAGIAPDASVMPLRVLDAQGRGNVGAIADAIRFAADNGAHIINLSLGGPLPSLVMDDAIQYARRRGVLVIAAAGNSATSLPSYPAGYRGVVAVSATQYDRTLAFYSNHGRTISIAAPGGNTRVDQSGDGRPDGILQETIKLGRPGEHEFGMYMGTSMAAPHVAGVAALVYSQGITHPERIREVLLSTASRDVPAYDKHQYGAGLLDADAATRAAVARLQVPRLPFALLVGLAFLPFFGSGRRERLHAGVFVTVTALTGFGLTLLPGLGGLVPGATATTSASVSLMLHNALAMSALSVLAVYALFGQAAGAVTRGAVIGVMLGITAWLGAEALLPLHDVQGIPGVGGWDRLWLGLNALMGAVLVRTAMRRAD